MLAARHPVSAAIVATALALTAGVFLFARPAYHPPHQGETIKLPSGTPAADAAGAAGWVWTKATPGWVAGQMFGQHHDFNASGVQPVELQPAELAAARNVLDADGVRVLESARLGNDGVDAILAAPQIDVTPSRTCLAVLLPGSAPVRWQCPGARPGEALDRSHVLLMAAATRAPSEAHTPLFVLGVARGDVRKIVQVTPGIGRETVYTRGGTWGQFMTTRWAEPGARLLVYGDRGLAQTVSLDLRPGATLIVG